MRLRTTLGVAGLLVLGLAASCGDAQAPTAPTAMALAGDLQAALERSLQDEYRAETIYQGVVADLGPVLPFVNVLTAEQRHSTSIERLYAARGASIPASTWTLANVPRFAAVRAACLAGVTAERENIAVYDDLLRFDLPADVRQVFAHNRSASLLSHLPAFEGCS